MKPGMADDGKPHRVHGRSPEIWAALREAGIVREDDYVRRVIIDIDVSAAVTVYVERYGDSRVLDLIPVLGNAEIRGVPAPAGEPGEDSG